MSKKTKELRKRAKSRQKGSEKGKSPACRSVNSVSDLNYPFLLFAVCPSVAPLCRLRSSMRSLECRRGLKTRAMVNDIITQKLDNDQVHGFTFNQAVEKSARPGEHQYQAHLAATHPKPQSAVEVRAG